MTTVLLVLGALGDSKTELGSYMALAEDEEIGSSEKDSMLRQKTASRLHSQADVRATTLCNREVI